MKWDKEEMTKRELDILKYGLLAGIGIGFLIEGVVILFAFLFT